MLGMKDFRDFNNIFHFKDIIVLKLDKYKIIIKGNVMNMDTKMRLFKGKHR